MIDRMLLDSIIIMTHESCAAILLVVSMCKWSIARLTRMLSQFTSDRHSLRTLSYFTLWNSLLRFKIRMRITQDSEKFGFICCLSDINRKFERKTSFGIYWGVFLLIPASVLVKKENSKSLTSHKMLKVKDSLCCKLETGGKSRMSSADGFLIIFFVNRFGSRIFLPRFLPVGSFELLYWDHLSGCLFVCWYRTISSQSRFTCGTNAWWFFPELPGNLWRSQDWWGSFLVAFTLC